MTKRTIKLLALIEGATVTGPAKNLINFCRRARSSDWQAEGLPCVETSIVTFVREGGGAAHSPEGGGTNKFVAAAREAGVAVDVLRERFRFDPRVVGQLSRVVERRAPDIIQTHMIKSHFLVKLSGLGRRYPWVAFHHGYTTTDLKMQVYNQFNRWSLPSARRVVTVCGPFARQLAAAGVPAGRISVRHNSVARAEGPGAGQAGRIREQLGVAPAEQLVLAVGRFSREKGHADLVEAAGILRRDEPALSFKLVLVGDGPERPCVESRARELGVGGEVIFAGHTDDVRPYYAAADVLALPSHSEGSPNVLLEAMAAGLPVVATDVGGVSEIVADEESALLVAPREPRALASALGRMLSDRALSARLAETAAVRADEFSPESYTRSLIEIYRGILYDAPAPAAF